jgi:hypothetical protein
MGRAIEGGQTMKKVGLTAAALVLGALAMMTPASAQAGASLTGVWSGYYGYDGQSGRVPFQAKLAAAGATFAGTTIEPNTFGEPTTMFLTANVVGQASNGAVSFIKTYDGTGGQTHSVSYRGTLTANSQCVAGTWTIDAISGPFQVCRDARLVS